MSHNETTGDNGGDFNFNISTDRDYITEESDTDTITNETTDITEDNKMETDMTTTDTKQPNDNRIDSDNKTQSTHHKLRSKNTPNYRDIHTGKTATDEDNPKDKAKKPDEQKTNKKQPTKPQMETELNKLKQRLTDKETELNKLIQLLTDKEIQITKLEADATAKTAVHNLIKTQHSLLNERHERLQNELETQTTTNNQQIRTLQETNKDLTQKIKEIKEERNTLMHHNKEMRKQKRSHQEPPQPPKKFTLIADSNRKHIAKHLNTPNTTWTIPTKHYTTKDIQNIPDADIDPTQTHYIMIGTNDIRHNNKADPTETATQIVEQAERIQNITNKPTTIITPPPTNTENRTTNMQTLLVNDELAEIALIHNINLINTHNILEHLTKDKFLTYDGFHLNEHGGEIIGQHIAKHTPTITPTIEKKPMKRQAHTPEQTKSQRQPAPHHYKPLLATPPTPPYPQATHKTPKTTPTTTHPEATTTQIQINSEYIGHIIGKNGLTLKSIVAKTNTFINIEQDKNANNEQTITIKGQQQNIKQALHSIQTIINTRHNYIDKNENKQDTDTTNLIICKHFNTVEGCRNGNHCIYHHPIPITPTTSQSRGQHNYNRNRDRSRSQPRYNTTNNR